MSHDSITTCSNGEPCQLVAEVAQLKEEMKRLSELVSSDPLTELFNYRHFSHTLDQEIERSQRTLQPTSLIMLDVDHFKSVNDQWGHEVGNQALKLIAQCICKTIRRIDVACRYGGEEFAVILPSSDIHTSILVAERIRQTIENTPLIINSDNTETTIQLTISGGLSMYNGSKSLTPNALVEAADEQLYQAKQTGRNKVCFAPDDRKEQQVSGDEKSALFGMFGNDNS